MTARTGKTAGRPHSARLSAWALGIAALTLSGAALADPEHGQHHDGAGNAHPQKSGGPAPAAASGGAGQRPAPAVSQTRPAPAANGWWRPQGQPLAHPQGAYTPARPQSPYQGRPANQPGQTFQQGQGYPQRQQSYQGQPRGNGGGAYGGHWSGPGPQGSGYGRPMGNGQWNHGWRQDNRYDWRGWRAQNGEAFHAGRYYPPYRDYYYNRLAIGYFLQPMFFAHDYWIGDPGYYHLPPAYGPFQWVRYYNDVLLVNTYTGEVSDVIYDFFW